VVVRFFRLLGLVFVLRKISTISGVLAILVPSAIGIPSHTWEGNTDCLCLSGQTMAGSGQRRKMRPIKRRALGLALGAVVVSASFAWLILAADSHLNDQPRATQFQFVRMEYPGGIPEYLKNWYTDYPAMDKHLTVLLQRLTGIDTAGPTLVNSASPGIFNYPLIYSVEPEQMVLGPSDITNLREYLARGGLWFADDFHGDEEFAQFLAQIRRVLPGASPVELDLSHPLFHCFYDIDKIIQVTNDSIAKCPECEQWENGPSGKTPKVFAIFDKHGRINILMAWNTDLGDGLEWADDPLYPAGYSAYSFKFLTNAIVYTLTH